MFLEKHLPAFADTPNSTRNAYQGKTNDFGFEDLTDEHQSVLAPSFASLLHMLLIEYRSTATPIAKFRLLLDRLVATLDLISLKEVEIARYLFARSGGQGTPTLKSMEVLRKNFAKTKDENVPKTAHEVLQIAFNGACDLHLMNAAARMDGYGLDGAPQDAWIATFDGKLARFCSIFHYIEDGENTGLFGVMDLNVEQIDVPYWRESLALRKHLIESRIARQAPVDLDRWRTVAHQMIAEVRQQFAPA